MSTVEKTFNMTKNAVVDGQPWELQDRTSSVVRGQITPGLLTALYMPNEIFNNTDTFRYDSVEYTQQIPEGKAYNLRGDANLTKDKPLQKYFAIPSFGLIYSARPQDYVGKRKFGTVNEFMTENDVIAELNMKAEKAWMLMKELMVAQLMTADTNYIGGGPFTEYNFYTDIIGSSRPAAVACELDDDTADHAQIMRDEMDKLQEKAEKAGLTITGFDVVCGNTFFNQRVLVEENSGFPREIKDSLDLATHEVPASNFGSPGRYAYRNFTGRQDGIRYINYGASITGTKMIADTAAYLIPRGLINQIVQCVYAPAQTRSYANTQALSSYSWSKVDEFQGVKVFQEKNCLMMTPYPEVLCTHLINT